jgi:HSP20 family protein
MALPSFRRSARDKGEGLPSREIWEPFSSLRRDMERAIENFSRDFGWSPPALAGMAEAPRVDVSETDSEVKIEAELPGVDEKVVEVVLSEGRLTIKGEKKQEKEEKKKDYHLTERSYGAFSRSMRLPFEADPDQVKASFEAGVLKITLPKPAEAKEKTRRIAIGGK